MKLPSHLLTSLGLVIVGINLTTAAQAAAWSYDITNGGFLNTWITGTNNLHLSVGGGTTTDFIRIAIWASVSGGATALPSLTTSNAGQPGSCTASAVSNGSATMAVIIGACKDGRGVNQGVKWLASNLAAAPQQQLPLPILAGLRLVPDVQTVVAAVNLAGVVAGVSISPTGEATPVIWTSAGAANSLLPPLLGSVTNCGVADINDAATPSIIGNCPAGAGGFGTSLAVLWANASSGYSALPVPSDASYCVASEINLSGKILGTCYYPGNGSGTPDTFKTVQWAAGGGSAPTVMLTINGSTSLRNSGIAMNALGQIAGNRLQAGGFVDPFYWDPATGTNGIPIPHLPGSSRATAKAIADNGVIVGCGEVAGTSEAFAYHSASGTLVAITPLASGGNDCANAISPNGAYAAGISESNSVSEEVDGVVINNP